MVDERARRRAPRRLAARLPAGGRGGNCSIGQAARRSMGLPTVLLALMACLVTPSTPAGGATSGAGRGASGQGDPSPAFQSLQQIRQAAEDFVRSRLPATAAAHHIEAMRLDPRLRLRACAAALQTFAANAHGSARTTVGVRCTNPVLWTLYVSVGIEIEAPVLVLRRALPSQAVIEAQDVERQRRRLPGSTAAFINELSELQGQRLRRAVPAGTVLTANLLRPDVVVHRGQQVTLLAANGIVEIRARGQALSEGGTADRVRVQNLSSRKIVEGVVQSDGVVRVDR